MDVAMIMAVMLQNTVTTMLMGITNPHNGDREWILLMEKTC